MLEHILVVDDDNRIRYLISKYLKENGYIVSSAKDINECEALINEFNFDLIILDIMMPNESGIDFLKRSQSVLKTPVIMLTALGDVDDRINGLESGADDYLSKPFEPKELLLRAKKLLSRNKDKKQYNLCIFGEYTFDIEKSQLTKNMQHIHLTTNESRMLQALAKRTGEIISREEMQEYFDDVNIRTIDVAIARLRNKIEGDNKTPQYLQTIRNQGYVLWGNLE